jgi:hypothetical protein
VNNVKDRNQIFAFRTTKDFTKKFDELCERLGYCRSEVVRYALNSSFVLIGTTLKTLIKLKRRCFNEY